MTQTDQIRAEMIAAVTRAGWREERNRRDVWRWRDPKTKALHTLKDAFDLLKSNPAFSKKS
jgi:hypothetical protein